MIVIAVVVAVVVVIAVVVVSVTAEFPWGQNRLQPPCHFDLHLLAMKLTLEILKVVTGAQYHLLVLQN